MRARQWAVVLGIGGGAAACALAFDTDVLVSDRADPEAGAARPADAALAESGSDPTDAGTDAPLDLIEDAATQAPLFVDDFARPDSPEIGNGWKEKNPLAFTLASSTALKQTVQTFYRDNLVFRPEVSEVDVEVVAEVEVSQWPCGSPQVHARVQPATADALNTLDSYLVFVEDAKSDAATLARQHSTEYSVKLASLPFPVQSGAGLYRLILRVKGAQTVAVAAAFEKQVAGKWERLQSAAYNDGSAAAIRTTGHVGFSGDKSSSERFRYTRFQVSRLE